MVRANECGAIHDAGDVFEPLRDADVIDGGRDRRKRAENASLGHADFEGRIALGVERFGGRHAAGHPEEDARIGSRARLRDGFAGARRAQGQRGEAGGSDAFEEIARVIFL